MALTFNIIGGSPKKGNISVTVQNGPATSVTATKDSSTISLVYNSSTSKWTAEVEVGVWTVTATVGARSKSGTVTVTADQTASLTLKIPNIPSAYTELTYIQGSANDTCTINTGYKPVSACTISGKFNFIVWKSGVIVWKVPLSSGAMSFQSYTISTPYYSDNLYSYQSSTNTSTSASATWSMPNTSAVDHTYSCKNRTVTLDGTGHSFSSSYGLITSNSSYNAVVHFSTSGGARVRHYYFNIQDSSGKYVRQMVPAKRNSDNKYGMYDKIGDTFYAASGSISPGSVVT